MLQGRVAHRAGIVLLVSVGAEKSGLVLWIHLVLLTFSGLLVGGPALGTALARDLNVVFEKDVAAVTPDMEVLPSGQGSISTNGGHNLEYHSGGLAKLKSKGVDIWAEGTSDIGDVPSISENRVLSAGFIFFKTLKSSASL